MTPEMFRLMQMQGDRARDYFGRGEQLIPLLDLRARMCVGMLAALYGDILARITAGGYDYTRGRVSLSGRRKASLMARSIGRAFTARRR
jgi:phytoene synthase